MGRITQRSTGRNAWTSMGTYLREKGHTDKDMVDKKGSIEATFRGVDNNLHNSLQVTRTECIGKQNPRQNRNSCHSSLHNARDSLSEMENQV
jgi:hypothetical protein